MSYYIYTMSAIEKSIVSNLEGELESIDFGEPGLNTLFKSLDAETKKKVSKYPKKEIQISILKNLADPELTEFWNSLSQKEKNQLDSFGIRDRFIFLKQKLKDKKKKEAEKPKLKTPTPSSASSPSSYKGDDELALEHRKTLLRLDAEDRKKIRDGTYQGDPAKWQPRVKSKYGIPFTPDGKPEPEQELLTQYLIYLATLLLIKKL